MVTSLVTGATGMVGSHLAERLAQRGDRVVALVRADSPTAHLERLGIRRIRGDLGSPWTLREALRGVDAVYHCAARPPIGGTPRQFWQANVEGTANLLQSALVANVARVVHVSTVDVYGYDDHDGADERTPYRADGLYSWSKIEAEKLAVEAYERDGLPVTVVRPCLIYGSGDRHVLPQVRTLLERARVPLLGGGGTLMDVVHVDDAVTGIVEAGTRPSAIGDAFNLTDGEQRTLRQVVEALAQAIERKPRCVALPYGPVYGSAWLVSRLCEAGNLPVPTSLQREIVKAMGHHRHFSIAKARRTLDYTPQVAIVDGFRRSFPELGDDPRVALSVR
ncbi:MAG: NAD-dependent epimerase/dehydratase family protein [Candidatus Bipolaricaulia bacterium]